MSEETTVDNAMPEDEFDVAFAAAAGEETADTDELETEIDGDDPPKEDPPKEDPPKEDPPKEDPPKEDPPKEDPPKEDPPKEDPPKEDPPKEDPPKPKPKEKPKPAEPTAEEKEAARKAQEEADKAAEEAKAKENFTEDEKKSVDDTKENFPDIAEAMEAYSRTIIAKVENMLSAKMGEVATQFDQKLAPVMSVAQQTVKSSFDQAVTEKHADAFTLLPQVEEWVESLPSFQQEAYNAVLDGRTADPAGDTIKLLDIFKKETGSAQTPTPKEEVKPEPKKQDPEKEEKLQAQEGVRGRQSSQKSGIDEDDFESAFNSAAH